MRRCLETVALIVILCGLFGCGNGSASPGTTPGTEAAQPPLTGWQGIGGSTYYYGADGIPHTGWLELEGKYYHFSDGGQLCTGWTEVDGSLRFFHPNGALGQGWLVTDTASYYLEPDGSPHTGWLELEGKRYHFSDGGQLCTGWTEVDGALRYFSPEGILAHGWLELEEGRYYLGQDGAMRTGWLELDGERYYFLEDGTMARGRVDTRETGIRHFTSTGKEIILVIPWNYVPADYAPTLADHGYWQVAAECLDALEQMLADCADDGHTAIVVSAYRTHEYQIALHQRRIQRFLDQGLSLEQAQTEAAKRVAVPGTSEHELGLAVDIVDIEYQNLNEQQEQMPAQKWLMEHAWRYGFILRYPNGKSEHTGIIYEPWHYRYVGRELAEELHGTDLCLEEYLERLTVRS